MSECPDIEWGSGLAISEPRLGQVGQSPGNFGSGLGKISVGIWNILIGTWTQFEKCQIWLNGVGEVGV